MKYAANIVLLTLTAGSAAATTILDVVVGSEVHTTLEAAVLAAPSFIAETLGDPDATLTLFAPDDTAFANLVGAVGQDYVNDLLSPPWSAHLTCVLTSHVLGSVVPSTAITGPLEVETLSGYEVSVDNMDGTVTVDGNPVTGADIEASNGVIHSISALPILPPCVTTNIYDLGSSLDDLSTLISLVDLADLTNAVSNTRPLTLFAPTNKAFEKLPSEVVTYLTENVDALTSVLTYHVVNDLLLADGSDLDGESFTTLNGDVVTFDETSEKITVQGIPIKSADNLASNGVVHLIDSVLIPPGFSLPGASPAMSPAMSPVMSPTMSPTYTDKYSGKKGMGSESKSGSMGSMGMGMGMGKRRNQIRALEAVGLRGGH